MTPAELKALGWLSRHNGTGVYGREGLLAGGEWSPWKKPMWDRLRVMGHVSQSTNRVSITRRGTCYVQSHYRPEKPLDHAYDGGGGPRFSNRAVDD